MGDNGSMSAFFTNCRYIFLSFKKFLKKNVPIYKNGAGMLEISGITTIAEIREAEPLHRIPDLTGMT